jgi:hypothetical protein
MPVLTGGHCGGFREAARNAMTFAATPEHGRAA